MVTHTHIWDDFCNPLPTLRLLVKQAFLVAKLSSKLIITLNIISLCEKGSIRNLLHVGFGTWNW